MDGKITPEYFSIMRKGSLLTWRWEQVPPRVVLGLKAHVLGQFCNKVVKSPHFMVMEREGVQIHKGFSTLIL